MKRKEGAFVAVLAGILVAVIALVSLSEYPSAPSESQSTVGSNGLQLSMTISATKVTVGEPLTVTVSLFNTLPKVNDVPTSDDWPFQGVPVAFWPACDWAVPMPPNLGRGNENQTAAVLAVVLRGDYTLANLSGVANVLFGVDCAEGTFVDDVIFQPDSSEANFTGTYILGPKDGQAGGPFYISTSFTTSGYWDLLKDSIGGYPVLGDSYGSYPPGATPFVPGVYTVAFADEWGQAVMLHFVVKG
jgi:hypothetical protein